MATHKAMATLFDCDRSVITKHLGNIFDSGELKVDKVCAKFAHTASDGKTYQTQFYSLDAIIAVGYRVNSSGGYFARRISVSETISATASDIEASVALYDRVYIKAPLAMRVTPHGVMGYLPRQLRLLAKDSKC